MDFNIIFGILCATILSGVVADKGTEVKRGDFPFMAFVYYPDEKVTEDNGRNFARGAFIIKPQWLVSAAIDPIVTADVEVGFPTKTLMARAGAVSIDTAATLYEDEKEQEKEVITLIRPKGRDPARWWLTDITILKTLTPFDLTLVVNVAPVNAVPNGSCFILVYARMNTSVAEDKNLMRLDVELLPATAEACGSEFDARHMTCGYIGGGGDTKLAVLSNPDYCMGNAGGPLVCDSGVVGLQTYNIETKCRQPQMFQMLAQWKPFVLCATEDPLSKNLCADKVEIINKDEPKPAMDEKNDTTAAAVATDAVDSVPTTENADTVETTVVAEVNDSSTVTPTGTGLTESQSTAESNDTVSTSSVKQEGESEQTTVNSARKMLDANDTEVADTTEDSHGNSSKHITSYYKPKGQAPLNEADSVQVPDSIEITNWNFGNKCSAEIGLITVCFAILF